MLLQLEQNNKRIAKNTLIIYIRLIVTTLVGVITSRYVLQALGVSDFGLYNVVGGLIAMLNILSTAMTTTTIRFINVEIGKKDGNPNKIFNISVIIHICFALGIFIVAETVGLYYIYHYLKLSDSCIDDAIFVFQISTFTATLGVINVPYQALMNSFEKFNQIAIADVLTSLFKLAFVCCVLFKVNEVLRWYAIGISILTIFSFIFYHVACKIQWPQIIRFRFCKEKHVYKKIIVFNNYTALGAFSYLSRSQGSTLLVNYFFGTIINGAMAIGYQVENYIMMFIGNIANAAYPQIMQSCSSGNIKHSIELTQYMIRIGAFLMMVIIIPLYSILPALLRIWLGNVPNGALLFCQCTLLSAIARSFSTGLPPLIQAVGDIKWFQILTSSCELSCLLFGFILFKLKFPPETIIILYSIVSIINIIVDLGIFKFHVKIKIKSFWSNAYKDIILVLIPVITFNIILSHTLSNSVLQYLLSLLFDIICIYTIGLNRKERRLLTDFVYKKIKK